MGTIYQVQATPTQILTGFQDDYIQLTNSGTGLIWYANDSSGLSSATNSNYLQTLLAFLEPGASVVIEPYTEIWAMFSGLDNYTTAGVGSLTSTNGVSNKYAYSQPLRTVVVNQQANQTSGTILFIRTLSFDPAISGNVQSVTVTIENAKTSVLIPPQNLTISFTDSVTSLVNGTVSSITGQPLQAQFSINNNSYGSVGNASVSATFPVQGNAAQIIITGSAPVSVNEWTLTVVANGYSVPSVQTHQSAGSMLNMTQYAATYRYAPATVSLVGPLTTYFNLPTINSGFAALSVTQTSTGSGTVTCNFATAYSSGNYVVTGPTLINAATAGTSTGFANNILIPKGINAIQVIVGSTGTLTGFSFVLTPNAI